MTKRSDCLSGIITDALVELVRSFYKCVVLDSAEFVKHPVRAVTRKYSAQKLDLEDYTKYRKIEGTDSLPYADVIPDRQSDLLVI